MSNKIVILLIALTLMTSLSKGEIIKISRLKKAKQKFLFKRDIFYPKLTKIENIRMKINEKREELQIKDEKLKQKHEELFDNIIYEGFVVKNNKKTVLLSIDGEYSVCREGDTILEKIKLLKATIKYLKIEIEGKAYKIDLKEIEDEK